MLMRFFLLAILCAGNAAAQAPAKFIPPRMMLADSTAAPIELQKLSISAEISGGMAETTVRMVFFNPNPRQLEGNLQFPLLDGQQITSFALDINGKLRAAVPVDKARGREVFEEIERRRVDPGLLEVTQGNNFKLRVYPILPGATRTVELSYSEPLARRGSNWAWRLPLAYGQVRHFELRLKVNDRAAHPSVSGIGSGLQLTDTADGYQASLAREQFLANTELDVLTQAQAAPRVYQQTMGDATWFLAEIPVQSRPIVRASPKVIGLLWDSSGSGQLRNIPAELAELDAYFRALGDVEVHLVRLRDRPEVAQQFKVMGGDWRALRSALESTIYDGASALNDWTPEPGVDQYLLVSDGLSNYGGASFPTLSARQTLFALNSAMSADTARLGALAERHRGQLIAVNPATPGAAAHTLLYQEAHIEDISASGATDLEVDSHTVSGGMLRVAGRLLAPAASLSITLSNGGKMEQMNVPLAADAPHHPRAGATWAQFRLRTLDADFETHRAEIARIGRRFGIPTRETSLIVLELMEDYLKYEIEPPAEMRDAYRAALAKTAQHQGQQRSQHIEQIVRMFEARKAWWARPIVPQPVIHSSRDRKEGAADANDIRRVVVTGSSIRRMDVYNETPLQIMTAPSPAPSPVSAPLAMKVAASAMEPGAAGQQQRPATMHMQIQKWTDNAPYMERLAQAKPDQIYQVYLDLKPDYANSSAFYLDVADLLLGKGQRDLALRVLSNLAEMDLENRAVLRILGYRLIQAGAPKLAVPVFEQVRRIAAEEPQSFRDLGLALAAAGKPQAAIDTMYEVVTRPWADRFPDIETITMADINALIATSSERLDTRRIDRRLLATLPLDLRIVLTWDAGNSHTDLYVTDPLGEQCFYGRPDTSIGGHMSRDIVGGYGPAEYILRRARPGKYKVHVSFSGNDEPVITGSTTLQVKLVTGFGTHKQKEQLVTLRLKERGERVFVGDIDVK